MDIERYRGYLHACMSKYFSDVRSHASSVSLQR